MIETTIGNSRNLGSRSGVALVALALICLAQPARAQQIVLTRAHVAALVRQAPQAKTTEAQVAVSRVAVTAAGVLSLENPVLSGMGGLRFKPDGSRPLAATATLSWPIDWGGKRGSRKEAASAEYREAQVGGEAQQRRLLLAALLLHATAIRDEQQLTIVNARKANAERMLATARKRREAGSVPQLDVALATLQQGRDSAAASTTIGERNTSLLALTALLGVDSPEGVQILGSLVPEGEPPPFEMMLRQVGRTADVRVSLARVEAAQARANRERSAAAPTISVLAQYERDDAANVGTVGVAIPLAVLNANTLARATSAAEVRAARAEHVAARMTAVGEIRQLYSRYEATKRAREALAPTAGAVKEAASLALRAYELGEADLASVLLVHREALEAQRALLDVEYAHANAKLELFVAAGKTPQ